MNRYRYAIDNVRNHLRSLWVVIALQVLIILALWVALVRLPSTMTVHIPPDLRRGASLAYEEIPRANVYAFAFYILQQLNRWPANGAHDYGAAIFRTSAYLTPEFRETLIAEMQHKARVGELTHRVRGLQAVPGEGYSPPPRRRRQRSGMARAPGSRTRGKRQGHDREADPHSLPNPCRALRGRPGSQSLGTGTGGLRRRRSVTDRRSRHRDALGGDAMKRFDRIAAIVLTVALLMISAISGAKPTDPAPRRVHWQDTPIAVALSVAHERRVQFPAPVSVGVPASLQALLRVQTVNGSVYLRAHAPFPETRVLVRELASGQTYLLDLNATTELEPSEPLIVDPEPLAAHPTAIGRESGAGPHRYVTLTRFAAQQLFAPERLAAPIARCGADSGASAGRCACAGRRRGGHPADGVARWLAVSDRRQTQEPQPPSTGTGSASTARPMAGRHLSARTTVAPPVTWPTARPCT